MIDGARHVLREVFGFAEFRPGQEEVIRELLGGGDALLLMPTGGGKSLCYQIPALVRPGVGIVVSPLIALMQDQVTALRQAGARAAFLNSTLEPSEARRIERQLLDGGLDLVYMAPERLMTERTLELLGRARLALFAIDEAHCVSQWGHDFRPEYLQLSSLHERFPNVPRIALTATADEPTRRDIIARLGLGEARRFVHGFDRPNIRYRVTEKASPRQQLTRFLEEQHRDEAGIVYCMSRRRVEQTAAWLVERGFAALPYHAGLPKDVRQQNQDRFICDEGRVMVATIAFGMGIDKPDVRFVAHLDLPKSLEAYYQETGRAGRDGLPADAWMVYGLQDVILLRRMLEESEAPDGQKRIERQRLEAMLGYCEVSSCRRQVLLAHFGDRLVDPCGNCDTCLNPVETWDGTEAAQKAMSSAFRTGQRFGVNYLIDVLLGNATERIVRFGHDRLKTFGIGTELDSRSWRSVFRQLVARGLLTVDLEGFGALKLTPSSRAVLQADQRVTLRRDPERRPAVRSRRGRDKATFDGIEIDRTSPLFTALRQRRLELATEQGVPPYVIFHDATLMHMVAERPTSREAFSRLSGVGQTKLERYADTFMAVIREHAAAGPAAE